MPGLLPLLLLAGWMVFQVIPMPSGVLKIISPGSFVAYEPLYGVMGEEKWFPISVNVKSTVFEFLRISSYILLYFLAIQLFSNGRYLRKTVSTIVWCSILIAFFAILQKFTSPANLIYWVRPVPEFSSPFGPWVNRNQYAGFMCMILPLIFGLLYYFKPRFTEDDTFRTKLVAFLSSSGSNLQIYLAFGLILVLLSIFLTLSRGGILVVGCSFILYFFLLSRKRKVKIWPLLLLFIVGFGLYSTYFGTTDIANRVNAAFTADGSLRLPRIQIWADTIEMVKVFWLTGSGFGTFIDMYPVFKTIEDVTIYDHAHNDYLEILSEGGIISLILSIWFVGAVFYSSWKMAKKRNDQYSVFIAISALVGMSSMLLYSITDFNMHNGADGLYFFLFCALAVSAAHTRFHYHRSSTLLKKYTTSSLYYTAATAITLILLLSFIPFRAIVAQTRYGDSQTVYISRQLSPVIMEKLNIAIVDMSKLDPLEGVYKMVLGNIAKYRGERDEALQYYIQASQKNPMRGEFLQQVALMLGEEKSLLSSELMELSYQRSLKKDQLMLNYAEWLIWKGDRKRSIEILEKGVADNNELLNEAKILINTTFDRDEIVSILPDRVQAWIDYGHFLEITGEIEESEFYRSGALQFIDDEKDLQPEWFSQLYKYYLKHKRAEDAVDVLRLAVEKIPGVFDFHFRLGDYYRSKGILYRAKEEYEHALIAEPGNEFVIQRLENLQGASN